jgi:hypothetical protein
MENQGRRPGSEKSSMQFVAVSLLVLIVLGLSFLVKYGLSFFA